MEPRKVEHMRQMLTHQQILAQQKASSTIKLQDPRDPPVRSRFDTEPDEPHDLCGISMKLHYDTSGCLWMGCYDAFLRVQHQIEGFSTRQAVAIDHAIVASALPYARLLYDVQHEDEEAGYVADGSELTVKELRVLEQIITTAFLVRDQMLRHRALPVAGHWQQQLAEARQR